MSIGDFLLLVIAFFPFTFGWAMVGLWMRKRARDRLNARTPLPIVEPIPDDPALDDTSPITLHDSRDDWRR